MTDKNDRKPPLLTSDSEPQCRELLKKILPEWDIMSVWTQGKYRDVAQAQRKADIKFYAGEHPWDYIQRNAYHSDNIEPDRD